MKHINCTDMNVDINIIENFIYLYELVIKYHNEYQELCNNIKKQYNIPNNLNIEKLILKKDAEILNKVKETKEESKKKELMDKYNDLMNKYNELKNYNKIVKLFEEIQKESLKPYIEPKSNDEIGKMIDNKYPNLNKSIRNYKIISEKEKIEEQQKSSIEQIYINVKYLIDALNIIRKYKETSMFNLIKKIKLKKELKKLGNNDNNKYNYTNKNALDNNIEFVSVIFPQILQFNKENETKINEAVKEAQKLPEEIEIADGITIITKSRKEQIYDLKEIKKQLTTNYEEPIYKKTA